MPEPLTPRELDELVLGYFAELTVMRSGTRPERLALANAQSTSFDHMVEMLMTAERAERAWPAILALVERAPNDQMLFEVAAGPLEDLIRTFASQFGDRILERARRDSRFRVALHGVWGWEDVQQPLRSQILDLLGDLPITRRAPKPTRRDARSHHRRVTP